MEPTSIQPRTNPNWLSSRLFADYFWFVIKNVIGWLLILISWPVGILLPGPGGIPLFLIGFAMITFPGKRALTARVLRGRLMNLRHRRFRWFTLAGAALLPAGTYWFLRIRHNFEANVLAWHPLRLMLAYVAGFFIAWLLVGCGLYGLNILLHYVPAIRRKVRPWLRARGIDLLPPRHKKRLGNRYPSDVAKADERASDEILVFHERHYQRVRSFWTGAKGPLKRVVSIAFAVVIFGWLVHRIIQHWAEIRPRAQEINFGEVALASVLFAIFLVLFRMVTWWRILAGLGHPILFRPALRIWSMSELARYVGSGISQMIGRVYLCKPYGVDSGTASASQILELALFLLANTLVGVSCMIWLGVKIEGKALSWFYVAIGFIPLLLTLLHPRIFYGIFNLILARLGKPLVTKRLSAWQLSQLLAWNIVGLFFQGWTIWLVTHRSLGLKPQHWWVVTGAYCLAWMAGFIAVWAQAGIGVREPVFVLAAWIALPTSVRQVIDHPKGLLMFISLLLRLWSTAGEMLLAIVAYFLDYRGALGSDDAPGRVAPTGTSAAEPAGTGETGLR